MIVTKYYSLEFGKWSIDFLDNDNDFVTHLSRRTSILFNMDKIYYMNQLIKFGGRPSSYKDMIRFNSTTIIYFDTKGQVDEALRWLESLIVMNKLSEI
jgi:hypothetical protein